MTPTWALLTSVGVVFAVVLGGPDVGGVYTGALVLPELPLVVAPHPTDAITPASAIIRITPDIGFSPPRTDRQTRSTERSKQRKCPGGPGAISDVPEVSRCSSVTAREPRHRRFARSSNTTARPQRTAPASWRRSLRQRTRRVRRTSEAPLQVRQ